MSDYVLPLTLGFFAASLVGYFGRLLFASKCQHFECCWGMVEVDRSIKLEKRDIQLDLSMSHATPQVTKRLFSPLDCNYCIFYAKIFDSPPKPFSTRTDSLEEKEHTSRV